MVLHANRFVSMCSNPKLWGDIQNGDLKSSWEAPSTTQI